MQLWLDSDSSSNFKTTAVQEWGGNCAAERVYHIPSNPQAPGKIQQYNSLLQTALQGKGISPLQSWGAEGLVDTEVQTHHSSPAENRLPQVQLGSKVWASRGNTRIEKKVTIFLQQSLKFRKEGVLTTWRPENA